MAKYNRVLLKLSGEALQGNSANPIDNKTLSFFISQIKDIVEKKIQVGIVIGGGNFFRGVGGLHSGIDRITGDNMGMLATVMNGLALESAFKKSGLPAILFTAFTMGSVGARFSAKDASAFLDDGHVVIMAGGTGNPFFTTDTAAALRAFEIQADALLKGTRVDGVYSADPEKDTKAVKYTSLSFHEAYQKQLKIMDLTAFTMCMENNLPIIVFNMNIPGNLQGIIEGQNVGTIIS